jgi:hypothetical protein
MNNRERWVIYPLLLWSLAMGFRSQYEYLFERDVLRARAVTLVDDSEHPRLILTGDATGGEIQFTDANGNPQRILKAEPETPDVDM